MRIKYNLPMLNKVKDSLNNIERKIKNNKERKAKVPMRYYTLLILMLLVGMITFTSNVKKYNDLNIENYTKYDLPNDILVSSKDIEAKEYETAISSISTNVSNIIEDENQIDVINQEYTWPVNGEIIKDFAINSLAYSKTLEMWRVHPGIDIKAKLGTEVVAIACGEVVEKLNDSFYGNTIKIRHEDGYISVYCNLESIEHVEIGAKVQNGEVIGNIGVSAQGEIADESHLHFELIKDNKQTDPLIILE